MNRNNATLTTETRAIYDAIYAQAIVLFMTWESCDLGTAMEFATREMDGLQIAELQDWWVNHICKGDILDIAYIGNKLHICINY